MSNLYPLVKSKEYQQKSSNSINIIKASIGPNYYNLPDNKDSYNSPKFEYFQSGTKKYKNELYNHKQGNIYENNDILSLNVDLSNDETDNDDLSKSPTDSSLNIITNQQSVMSESTMKMNIDPQIYSLELSTLSSMSSYSSTSCSKTDNFATDSLLSVPTNTMCNSKILDHENVSFKKSNNSIFTSISSTDSFLENFKRNDVSIKNPIVTLSEQKVPEPRTNEVQNDSQYFVKYGKKDIHSGNSNIFNSLPAQHLFLNSKTQDKAQERIRIHNQNRMNMRKKQLNFLYAHAHKQHKNLMQSKWINKLTQINVLDEYLLVHIFSMLDTVDKLMLQFVCKRWHHIIRSQEYTYKLFKHIEINQSSTSLYRYMLSFKNTDIASRLTKDSKIIKFIRNKFAEKALSSKKYSKQNYLMNLDDLKENNFIKFHINADLVLEFLLNKLLNRQTYPFSLCVESIEIKNNHWFTDRGVDLISRRCPELSRFSIRDCSNIKTNSITNLISKCKNMKSLDLTGCFKVSNIIFVKNLQNNNSNIKSIEPESFCRGGESLSHANDNFFYLQHIDLSHCSNITDTCVLNICKLCIYVKNLYLRKCQLITDLSMVYISKYCYNIRELCLSQCNRITDTGVNYLGDERLNMNKKCSKSQLKYLNLSKCFQITDESLMNLSNKGFFKQIRHLNLRGCHLITDRFVKAFSGAKHIQTLQKHFENDQQTWNTKGMHGFIPFQLRTLDLSYCSVTDKSIEYLCRMISVEDNMERLFLSNCTNITDYGIRILALNCKVLKHLDVRKCEKITAKSLKEIKITCNSCIIQHTNFSFC